MNKPYLFISHSTEDKDLVAGLRRALNNLGLNAWTDPPGSPDPRDSIQARFETQMAIESASAFVVVVSPASGKSGWVEQELRYALAAKTRHRAGDYPVIALALNDDDLGPLPIVFPVPPYIPLSDEPADIEAAARAIAQAMGMNLRAGHASTRRIRIPDIAWVEIPAGPFIYQEGETRELPTFWIAKYPVTNLQYQCFIEDGGYADARWWRELWRPEPAAPRWKQANRPRTDVDWYEAMAFSRWLCARLGQKEGSVRLPTEEEWERAARGTGGRIYPWGTEYRSGYANVDEKSSNAGPWSLEQTTAVGVYPHGKSPDGVHDLAGTVWEWCLNKYDQPEVTRVYSSDDRRVLRGGSWGDLPDDARADLRRRDQPDYRSGPLGFRLVSSVPMVGDR